MLPVLHHHLIRLPLLFMAALLLLAAHPPASAAQQVPAHTSADQVVATADAFLERQVQQYLETGKISGRHQIRMGRLDPRLRLAGCEKPLEASLENTDTPLGRITLRVRCEGVARWSVFVPAQVSLFRDVVVSTRPLKRNTSIQAADITLAERDISQLRQGYLLDPAEAIGNTTVRGLAADQPLSPSQIRTPPVIRRGDQVVISARSGTVSVRMPGEALSDGSTGQQIRVRNLRSQRIVHARVTGPGQVEVPM